MGTASRLTLLLLLLLPLSVAHAATARGEKEERAAADSSPIVRIADEVWKRTLERDVGERIRLGLPIQRLPSLSLQAAEDEATFAKRVLARLDSVGPPTLGSEDWNLAVVLRWRAEAAVADARYFWFQNPVSPYANPFLRGIHPIFTTFQFKGAEDLDRYVDLLSQYPRLIDEYARYLQGQRSRAIIMPKDELAAAIQLMQGFELSPSKSLFAVDSSRLAAIDPARASRFRAQVAGEIAKRVNPALNRLIAYLGGPYAAVAPTTVGLAQYPGGTEYYRYLVRQSLTFDTTPEEIHQLGLRDVARLDASMDSIRQAIGFQGSKADFHRYLRTDRRFVPRSPDDVRQRMLGFVNALVPKLTRVFAVVPSTPYDVRRLDPSLEPGMTFGYYRGPTAANNDGVYFFNGAQLNQKTLVWYEGLSYHELMPGHHFQAALLRDQLSGMHPLRRGSNSTAYSEGWAEYAAGLAGELGGYADPYDRYGRLVMELFAAVRLVLDTGMNLEGWSRERAMQYMRENSLLSEPEITSETLRYCCDIPGQALGYRMGMLEFRKLRERADSALGSAFDLRDFHRLVMNDGPLPFTALAQRVEQYIAQRKGSAP